MIDENCTVAIVEDETVLREELAFQLRHMGFNVQSFATAAQFYRFLITQSCTLAVLDIGLDDEDGLSVCQHLRAHDSQIGIVFVTGRTMRNERLAGLAAGADAYLTKPVDIEELALILKRLGTRYAMEAGGADTLSAVGKWQLDNTSLALQAPNHSRIKLTVNELHILTTLNEHIGEICPYAGIALALGVEPDDSGKHRIEVTISRLRQKVKRETGLELPLRTIRGRGYLFET